MEVAGQRPIELRLFPAPWTSWDWGAYVRTEVGQYSVDPATGQFRELAPPDERVLDALRTTSLGRAYLQFAQFPVVMTDDGGVILGDIRFVRDGRVGFACRFDVDAVGRISNGRFEF